MSYMRRSTLLLACFSMLCLLLTNGCGSSMMGGAKEGTIEYAMSFPDLDPNGLMADMLPDKTVLSFNQEHQSLDLSAGMGVFKTSMVVNTPARVLDYHMSVMGKNLMAELHPRDLPNLNEGEPPLTVVYTSAVDTIAGYRCRQAYVIYENIGRPAEEVWFTDEIDMDTPNWFGPYSEVPGVLMRYDVVQHKIRMHMEATKVKLCSVDPALFQARPSHDKVSPDVLYQQMDEVLGAFAN
ncbi:MAG: hypothetical protein JST45_07365 [Bacteroidetes bacterium]|nr:hypothetical protein [Bacteroidota bacterium]